jgi:hypothetical protein
MQRPCSRNIPARRKTDVKKLLLALSASLFAFSVCLAADDLSVVVDPKADFSTFKTFAVRVGKIESKRPESDNVGFAQ